MLRMVTSMAAALLSPFESHRQRVLAADKDEHISSLIHCDWPPAGTATAQDPPLSCAAAPYLDARTLSCARQAAACNEVLAARRLARAAKQSGAQQRAAALGTAPGTSSDDDSLDVLIDAILASESVDDADSGESRIGWRR